MFAIFITHRFYQRLAAIDDAVANYGTAMQRHEIQRRLEFFENDHGHQQKALEREEKQLIKLEHLLEEWIKTEYLLKGKEIRDKKELAHLKLVNARGSKVAKLIEWLRESIASNKENRFIIFSKVRLKIRNQFF